MDEIRGIFAMLLLSALFTLFIICTSSIVGISIKETPAILNAVFITIASSCIFLSSTTK